MNFLVILKKINNIDMSTFVNKFSGISRKQLFRELEDRVSFDPKNESVSGEMAVEVWEISTNGWKKSKKFRSKLYRKVLEEIDSSSMQELKKEFWKNCFALSDDLTFFDFLGFEFFY